MFNIRNLIPFTIIGGATFLVLYLFSHYSLPYVIAASAAAGVLYAFIVSVMGKAFFNRVIEKLMEKHEKEE